MMKTFLTEQSFMGKLVWFSIEATDWAAAEYALHSRHPFSVIVGVKTG